MLALLIAASYQQFFNANIFRRTGQDSRKLMAACLAYSAMPNTALLTDQMP
jgi:hypothetical protein